MTITLDPLNTHQSGTLSNNNLTISWIGNASYGISKATEGKLVGKWYWEVYCDNCVHLDTYIYTMGIMDKNDSITGFLGRSITGIGVNGNGYTSANASRRQMFGTTEMSEGFGTNSNFKTGTVVGILMDLDSKQFSVYTDGVRQGVIFDNLQNFEYVPVIGNQSTGVNYTAQLTINFGDTPFKYIPKDLPKGTRAYNGDLLSHYVVFKNKEKGKFYSIANNKFLVHVEDNTNDIIKHSLKRDEEHVLDIPFKNHSYICSNPIKTSNGKIYSKTIINSNSFEIKEVMK